MIVIFGIESREEDLPLVGPLVEDLVPVHVGVNDQLWGLRHVNLVADDSNSKRSYERFFLNEGMGTIGLAIAIGILKDHYPIPFRLAGLVASIAHALTSPDAPLLVDIDIGRIKELRSGGPHRDLITFWEAEEILAD